MSYDFILNILIAYYWWGTGRHRHREAGFVSTRDPVFCHAVHALPHLYASVIVMSHTGDHDIEQGQEGESGSFLPSECWLPWDEEGLQQTALPEGAAAPPQHGRPETGAYLVHMEDIRRLTGSVEGINDPSQTPKSSNGTAQDFDEGSDDLWSLYGKEAKSHDEEWIKVLKEDMDAILIFVRASFFCSAGVDVNSIPIPGWFILCCSHRVRRPKDSGFESEPCRRVSLLSESNSLYSWPNIATTRLGGPPYLFQLHSLPDLSSLGVRPPGQYLLAH